MKKIKKNRELIIVHNQSYKDKRGYFKEILLEKNIKKKFPFLVMSYSKKNVLRGLHLQMKKSQGKYISVIKGKIFDVAVDLRNKSPTFGKYYSLIISENSDFSFYIPEGFAHGFLCLSKKCTVNYKCSTYRDIKSEKTLKWNDETLNIKWPIKEPILSTKDKKGKDLNFFKK